MKKVLILTYVFPPVGGGGVQRTLKWTKYLHSYGWQPYVLTAKNPSVPLFDESLAREIPPSLPIARTRTFEPPYRLKRSAWNRAEAIEKSESKSWKSRVTSLAKSAAQRILTPDPQIGWWPTAYPRALNWIRAEKIDAMVVSAPPFSTLLLARKIAAKTGIPWVADFRDEWVDYYSKFFDFHRQANQLGKMERLEQQVVESASAFVTVTEGILNHYRKKYPRLDEKNSFWIPNGFDEEDFSLPLSSKRTSSRFTLTYSGTVFGVTSARWFLEGLEDLLKRRPDIEKLLKVRFIGRIDPKEDGHFDPLRSRGVVETVPYVPHEEAIRNIRSSDALLLLLADLPGIDRVFTGKVFEYLAARRPILAVVPSGDLQRFLELRKGGTVVAPSDSKKIGQELEGMIEAWKKKELYPPDGDFSEFSRRETARKLAQALSSLTT